MRFRHIINETGRYTFQYFKIHLLEDGVAPYEGFSAALCSEQRSSVWEVTRISAFEASNIGSFLSLTAQCIDCKQVTKYVTGNFLLYR